MENALKNKFRNIYRNKFCGAYGSDADLPLSVFERLVRRKPEGILTGEPISLTLVEDLVTYGRHLAKAGGEVEKRLGEIVTGLAVATEISRVDDIYRDLRSEKEHKKLDYITERNAQLKGFLERVFEENRNWLPSKERLILCGDTACGKSLLEMYADVKYGTGYSSFLGPDITKRCFTKSQKEIEIAKKWAKKKARKRAKNSKGQSNHFFL